MSEMSSRKLRTIELLAPAKNYEQGRAAILCGADALYVGAPRFGARSAAGVPEEEIVRLCDLAHRFGAKVYVAMNTLLYEQELADAERIALRRLLLRELADEAALQRLARGLRLPDIGADPTEERLRARVSLDKGVVSVAGNAMLSSPRRSICARKRLQLGCSALPNTLLYRPRSMQRPLMRISRPEEAMLPL